MTQASPAFLPFTRPSIDEATIAMVAEVLRSGWITSGPKVQALEQALSAQMQGRPVRCFASATAALEVALRLAGVGPGDEVLTPALTWVATSNVILNVGARPVFVDVDPVTRLMDLNLAAAAITPRTKAIMPVDLAGLPVPRAALYALAQQHQLQVIEDAAQSQGAHSNGVPVGHQGDWVIFSFHANKNITSSEGGCLVFRPDLNPQEVERWRLQGVLRDSEGTYDVDRPGLKANMTDVAAAIGLGQLPHLADFNQRRRRLSQRYFQRLAHAPGLGLPVDSDESNWHMFQVVLPADGPKRSTVMAHLRQQGIATGVHYPAVHQLSLYRQLDAAWGRPPAVLPHTEFLSAQLLTLPLFPAMSEADVDRVAQHLLDSLRLKSNQP